MAIGHNFPSVLQAARLGEEWAWTEIYRDLSPTVLRYLRAHGAPDAEDLLGEIFVSVVRGIGTFDGDEQHFRAWVFTLARHRLSDVWRRAGRRPLDYVEPIELHDRPGPYDTEGAVLDRFADERVRATLLSLTPAQRDIVFLRVIAGLSIEETARAVGKQSGAVKSLQRRGIDAIRREISGEAVS